MPQQEFPLQFANAPLNWTGSVADLIALLQSLGVALVPQGKNLIWTGPTPPSSDEGVGFNTTINQFMYWDAGSATYITQSGVVDIGEIKIFGSSSVDLTRYVLCDGSAIPRAAPYNHLFSKISVYYGSGDGSTTFNVPDCRGRSLVGVGLGTGLTDRIAGAKWGAETVILTPNQIPAIYGADVSITPDAIARPIVTTKNDTVSDHAGSPAPEGEDFGQAHENAQPSIAFPVGIRYA